MDMWSFFTPLPLPESKRYIVDSYIRQIHPELDPSKATVASLPNAKMAVAHYGCWAMQGDPHGRLLKPTRDRICFPIVCEYPPAFVDDFTCAALDRAATLIRFMVRALVPKHYKEYTEILANIDERVKLKTNDAEPFLSLFAFGVNGHTPRHRYTNDVRGGLAGLCTFGRYTGKSPSAGHLMAVQQLTHSHRREPVRSAAGLEGEIPARGMRPDPRYRP